MTESTHWVRSTPTKELVKLKELSKEDMYTVRIELKRRAAKRKKPQRLKMFMARGFKTVFDS